MNQSSVYSKFCGLRTIYSISYTCSHINRIRVRIPMDSVVGWCEWGLVECRGFIPCVLTPKGDAYIADIVLTKHPLKHINSISILHTAVHIYRLLPNSHKVMPAIRLWRHYYTHVLIVQLDRGWSVTFLKLPWPDLRQKSRNVFWFCHQQRCEKLPISQSFYWNLSSFGAT